MGLDEDDEDEDVSSFSSFDLVICVDVSPSALGLSSCPSPTTSVVSLGSGALASNVAVQTTTARRKRALLLETVRTLYERKSADDLLYLVLVLIDACVRPVPRVSMDASGGSSLPLVWCMLTNCGREVWDCVSDETCRAALDCLAGCGLNDQVCSYQCIVSYESELFEKFSKCVLQKHNCMRKSAKVPRLPEVEPMHEFRGSALTHEVAEEILIGWLGEERHSWKVVTGQNAAYDVFPNQHQIFYRGKRKRSFWYDPVFQARTFDGDLVWRRRHYRVRRGRSPGTFHFSVLDNGVISDEYWRIADAADDLSWAVLYYSGAASAAGQAYTGAVFVSRTGRWPDDRSQLERIERAHDKCGIKMWELFEVENYECEDAPLDPLEDP
ncbi:VDE domain-containing protein [Chloropicon primus]|uniref:VDE lipocalin domain-containing protein n=1 Tax=Chloropicon primus TaxID=1764295 RepID=A0A5B8MGQ5_9CHLO|nr:hypothetical protein A3770_03p21540 [Chloropicon primus]UPQ98848.1 VDE domain-containing protein [Chloropicon primus]|eukprot:QDZ19636.1 hypothetical protein A3770_03p21540 [Chloropicon primus]